MAALPPDPTPRCHHCLYTLSGLAEKGRCPECGHVYNTADGPPPTFAQKAEMFPEDLAIGVRDALPWVRERIIPNARNAAVITFVLGSGAVLVWAGWETMRAVFNKFGLAEHRGRPYPGDSPFIATANALINAAALTLQALPYALLALSLWVAVTGIQKNDVRLPRLTLKGADARSLGRFALGLAFTLAAILYWSNN